MAETYLISKEVNLGKCEFGQHYYAVASTLTDLSLNKTPVSLLSILNEKNSGKIVKITNIKIHNNDDSFFSSGFSRLNLSMSSNIQGGYDISPTKLDSNNSNVYTGVAVKKFSKSTQGNTIRRIGYPLLLNSITTTRPYDLRCQGGNKIANGRVLSSFNGSAETPIILRNGEGISLVSIESCFSDQLQVSILISDLDPGGFGDVLYNFYTSVSRNFDIFSIVNNESGTAIKITIIDLSFKLNLSHINGTTGGNNGDPGIYSVCKIRGTTNNTGDTVTPISLDSSNTLGNTGIETKEFARVSLESLAYGPSALPSIYTISGKFNDPDFLFAMTYRMFPVGQLKTNKFTPIVLNESEGIGVFLEIVPHGGVHNLVVEYTVENEAVTPGTCVPSASVYIG